MHSYYAEYNESVDAFVSPYKHVVFALAHTYCLYPNYTTHTYRVYLHMHECIHTYTDMHSQGKAELGNGLLPSSMNASNKVNNDNTDKEVLVLYCIHCTLLFIPSLL